MTETFREEIVQRITRNLLDIQILRLVQKEPMWGYRIKKQVRTMFGVKLRHGTLYPMLDSLEHKGFLRSKKQKRGGRTRRVYAITKKGRQYLEAYNNILQQQIEGLDIK